MTTHRTHKHKEHEENGTETKASSHSHENREHLASLAMQGILSNNDLLKRCTQKPEGADESVKVDLEDAVAEHAYKFADALLKQKDA
jgi:hypothetical protein